MLAQLTAGYKPLAWTTGGVANSEFPRLRLKQCLKETNHNGTQHCLFYMKQTGRRGGALQKSKLDRNIAHRPISPTDPIGRTVLESGSSVILADACGMVGGASVDSTEREERSDKIAKRQRGT